MSYHPWVLVTNRPLGLHCRRCGASLLFSREPVPVTVFLAEGEAFTNQHAACPEGAEMPPAQQAALL